ncbi:hypothetical protein [Actinoplanes sp. NPDC026619]|uniref:hypothetical protein n=1 Tax=Actinoplanes sp. NPDC026619 TaxID=3155798 RepID=UPI0034050FAF
MRKSHLSVVLAALLLGGVAGCAGNEQPAAPAQSASAAAPMFPLTITRRGGFAGVDDRAEITADGATVVTRRGKPPVRGSLPADAMADLRQLLTAPAFTGRPTPTDSSPVCADGYEYEVTSPSATTSVHVCGVPEDAAPARMVAIAATLFS